MIFIIVVLIVVICFLSDDGLTFYGGQKKKIPPKGKDTKNRFLRESPSRKISDALRIFIISNKINEILTIPENGRHWITTFYYAFINYLALNRPDVYADSYGHFPYMIPADVDAITKTLGLIKYDVILSQQNDMCNLQSKIDDIVITINSYKHINYSIETYTENIVINTDTIDITINKFIVDKYKVGSITELDVLSMLLKYTADTPYSPGTDLKISGSLSSIDPILYKKLSEMYNKNAIECYASPLNHTIEYLTVYRDICDLFPKCIGQLSSKFIATKHKTLLLANPPFDMLSIKLLYSVTKDIKNSTMLIIIPAKDIGVFSYAYGRKGSGRQNDWDNIKNFLKLPIFKGMLLLPSLFMYYVQLDSGRKRNISFDTLMIILSNDTNRNDAFFDTMKETIYDTIGKNTPPSTLRKKNLREIDETKIKQEFDNELASKLIKDMKLSKDKVFQYVKGIVPINLN